MMALAQKILVIKVISLGNVMRVHDYQQYSGVIPNMKITRVIDGFADILKLHPYFNRFINLVIQHVCK